MVKRVDGIKHWGCDSLGLGGLGGAQTPRGAYECRNLHFKRSCGCLRLAPRSSRAARVLRRSAFVTRSRHRRSSEEAPSYTRMSFSLQTTARGNSFSTSAAQLFIRSHDGFSWILFVCEDGQTDGRTDPTFNPRGVKLFQRGTKTFF